MPQKEEASCGFYTCDRSTAALFQGPIVSKPLHYFHGLHSNLINKHTATYPSLISWWWWSSTRSFYMQSYQLLGRIASSRSKNLVLMLMVLKNKQRAETNKQCKIELLITGWKMGYKLMKLYIFLWATNWLYESHFNRSHVESAKNIFEIYLTYT